MEQFTVKIGGTATASLSASSWETVSATVYGPVNYLPVLGINTFTFTAPFLWNGTDNIVIEICGGAPNSTSDVFYTGNSVVPWTTGLSFNGSHSYRADNLDNLCNTATTTNTGDQTTRPNIIINWTPTTPCSNPPVAGTAVSIPSTPICSGSNVDLRLNGISIDAGQTYEWQSSSTAAGTYTSIAPASVSPFYSIPAPASSMYYRAAVTCGGNTIYSTPVQVVVIGGPPPVGIIPSPNDTVCSGTSVILSTPSCTGCNYLWNTGSTNDTIIVNAPAVYSVSVSNACGVVNDSREIVYNIAPSMSLNADTAICAGSSTQLQANGANSYTWSPPTGLSGTTTATVTATPTVTTTYTVVGTVGSCTQNLTVTVSVSAVPAVPTITAGGTTICQGNNVTLTSSASAGNQWYKDGVVIPGAVNPTYNANASGSYTVRSTVNDCASGLSAATVITVNAVPAQPTITASGNVLTSSAASGNQWYLNGSPITGATSVNYVTSTSGLYTVQSTANGCASPMSATFNYVFTALPPVLPDDKFKIAPNPVPDKLYIRYSGNSARFTVIVINGGGAIMSRGSFTTNYDLDMRKYAPGYYIVRIVNEKTGARLQRVIIKQ